MRQGYWNPSLILVYCVKGGGWKFPPPNQFILTTYFNPEVIYKHRFCSAHSPCLKVQPQNWIQSPRCRNGAVFEFDARVSAKAGNCEGMHQMRPAPVSISNCIIIEPLTVSSISPITPLLPYRKFNRLGNLTCSVILPGVRVWMRIFSIYFPGSASYTLARHKAPVASA